MPPHRTPLERLFLTQRKAGLGSLGGTLENYGPQQQDSAPLHIGLNDTRSGEIAFSMAGAITAAESPRWYAPRDLSLVKLFGSLKTAGTATTTVVLKKNGTTVATLTFASGAHTASTTSFSDTSLLADTDYLTAEVTTAGASAADLDVQARHTVEGVGNVPTVGASSLDDLSDVDLSSTAPTDGQSLVYDSTSGLWLPSSVTGGATSLDGLTDVDTTTTAPSDGDRLVYDSASSLWVPMAAGAAMIALDDLTDVDTTTSAPADGDVLTFDSATTEWVPSAPAATSGVPALKRRIGTNAGNYTTTSTTRTPINATDFAFVTFTLAVGDIVECILFCGLFNSTSQYVAIDFEVDQPTSANVYIASGNDHGVGSHFSTGSPHGESYGGSFVATEAGAHGFRPVWFVTAGTGTLQNAASGASDRLPLFIARHWPQ